MPPQLIFGTACFGMDGSSFQDADSVTEVLNCLQSLGVSHLDVAARYPPNNPGRAEQLVGEASELSHDFAIDTKVVFTTGDGGGHLTPENIENSLSTSLERMKLDNVDILYAHRSDPSTPLDEQARGFDAQVKAGRCKKLGVSNYSPEHLTAMLEVCEKRGYTKPTVFQGDYNLITRGMEQNLLPILRKHGMKFYAFRPIASGFLTGNYTNNTTEGTRMSNDNPLGPLFQKLYGAEALQDAFKKFEAAVKGHDMSREAALRWLYWHSKLGEGDGIILGASKAMQVVENVENIKKGELPSDVVSAVEEMWERVKGERGGII